MIEPQHIAQVYRRLGALLAVAARHFDWKVLPAAEVSFDLRGQAAGQMQVRGRQVRLRFNAVLLQRDFDQFLEEVVAHELAHAVVHWRYGGRVKPHGPQWREVMTLFGVTPKRCHDYEDLRPVRRLQRYRYRCGCREHQLTAIRHRRIQRGEREYLCKSCGHRLTWVQDRP